MKNLVFVQDEEVLTDTLTVAEIFNKRHDLVLRDVRKTLKSLNGLADKEEVKKSGIDMGSLKFEETQYDHPQNKQSYPMYLLNFDSFMLVTMSYTTESAMLIKVRYMNKFNEMKEQLSKPKILTEKEQLRASMRLSLETSEDVEILKNDVLMLKDNMRIDSSQEFHLNRLGKKKVLQSLGGYKSPAYEEMSSKVFARFWRDFKQHFVIPRYSDLPKVKFDEGVAFIKAWQPDTSTRLEIQSINRQQTIQEVI